VIEALANRRLGPREFCKYQALGNDYLVIDGATWGAEITARGMAALCHRHLGAGSDGVLVLGPPQGDADATLRIFNPDGSEAEKSGNGLRIFGRALYDLGYVRHEKLRVRIGEALVPLTLLLTPSPADPSPTVALICAGMGKPHFDSASVHMAGHKRDTVFERLAVLGQTLDVTAVSMGNPHCVHFVQQLDVQQLRTLGPAIERHEMFLNRTNVQLVQIMDRTHLQLLIWERGAGETSASGSSSCAAVAAAQARGLIDEDAQIEVRSPGGVLQVQRNADGELLLTGPAEPVCRGFWLAGD